MSESTAVQVIEEINETNIPDVLKEIQEAFYDIPFENSQFQTEAFVIAAQVTPERAYRAIGLRMNAKIQALNEAKHGRAKEDIDIEELQAKIADEGTNDFDRRRAQLDVSFKLSNRAYTDKLINDAIAELNILYVHFKKLPTYTREQFELGERKHFEEKLTRQISNVQGPYEALQNMNVDMQIFFELEDKLLLENKTASIVIK